MVIDNTLAWSEGVPDGAGEIFEIEKEKSITGLSDIRSLDNRNYIRTDMCRFNFIVEKYRRWKRRKGRGYYARWQRMSVKCVLS